MSTLSEGRSSRSAEIIAVLTRAVQDLSLADSAERVREITHHAARTLTGADGATFVLRDDGMCAYMDEDAIEPLWKGQRFPLTHCISGWAMLNRQHVVIEDIYTDDRVPHDAYRPTFVRSLLMVPIRTVDPIGAIGIYWAEHHRATEEEIGLARALADSTAVALDYVQTAEELRHARALSETDPLTGVANRRAWDSALEHALHHPGGPVCVAVLDLDFFKAFNDSRGHGAGDELLKSAAAMWRSTLREGDLLARTGGEEFSVLLPGCSTADAHVIAERLRRQVPSAQTVSVGLAQWDHVEGAGQFVGRADAALYAAKAAGRNRTVVAPSA